MTRWAPLDAAKRARARVGTGSTTARRVASALARDRAAAAKIVAVAVSKALVPRHARAPVTLPLRWRGTDFDLAVTDTAGFSILHDVFVAREYDVELTPPPQVVLDLGSHVGISIVFFALRYPHALVVGCEPDPELFALLSANTRQLPNVRLVNAAIASRSGTVWFGRGETSWGGAVNRSDSSRVVDAITPAELLARFDLYRADIVKCDVEGAEFEVTGALLDATQPRVLLAEVHAGGDSDELAAYVSLLEGRCLGVDATRPAGPHTLVRAIAGAPAGRAGARAAT